MATLTCTCCERELNPKKIVALELDQRIGLYHNFGGVPADQSQGWFDFGATCALKANAKARAALEKKKLPFGKVPVQTFDDAAIEVMRRTGMLTAAQSSKPVQAKAKKAPKLKRASYRDAIFWIANNDDTQFLNDGDEMSISVSAALVIDLFGVPQEKFIEDLKREVAKARNERKA